MSARSLWAHRRRLAGTGVAVFLGVAFLVGTMVLGDTFRTNFERLFTETTAGTDVVVRHGTSVSSDAGPDVPRGLLDESVVDRVRAVDGVATAEPEISGYGQLLGSDGDPIGGNGPPRLAGSWLTTPGLNPYVLVEGRAPERHDEVVINRGAATAGDLSIGDRTVVQTPRPVGVTIVGIATFGDEDGVGDTTFAAFTLEGAQRNVTGESDRISSVVVRAEDGVTAEELRDRIAASLPDDLEAITGAELTDENLDALGFLTLIRAFLIGFAAIALLVATLSISNTFTITVAQRTRELAMLRSIGASRRQVRRMVTIEALLVGAVASVAGALGGLAVAQLLKGVFDAFGSGLPAGGLDVRATSIAIGIAAGVVVTVVAARAPARRAAKVAPIEALRDTQVEATAVSVRRAIIGTALTLGGAVVGTAGATAAEASALLTVAGALGIVTGALVVAPALLPVAARLMGAALRRVRGVNGDLAMQNARRQPRRTAGAAVALLIGVAVVSVFTVFAASASSRIDDQVSDGFGSADLAINTPVFGGGVLGTDLVAELQARHEVDTAVGVGDAPVLVDGDSTTVTATDLGVVGTVLDVHVIDGALPPPSGVGGGDADRAGTGSGPVGALVGESRAGEAAWGVGSTFDVTFVDGATVTMSVAAVVEDNELLSGMVLPEAVWAEHTPQPAFRSVFVRLADAVDTDAGRAAIGDLADRYSGEVQDRAELAASRAEGLEMLLGFAYVMLALAILIALLGIANTLSLAVHERRHEIGLLRAVGQTRRQVRSVLRLESVVVSTFGTMLGIVVGSVCGGLIVVAVFDGGRVVLPVGRLAIVAVLSILAGVVAAWRPARRASRIAVLDAIAAPS